MMASGYEKSDDYGGPPPRWHTTAFLILALAAIVAAFAIGLN
jgi:hypothetical protein